MEDIPSHLSLVIDLSPTQWHACGQASSPLSLSSFLAQLLTFLNSHIASKHENTLAVFAALPGKSVMLYPSTDQPEGVDEVADSNIYQPFKSVDAGVMKNILAEVDSMEVTESEAPCALVGALTKALCYINRLNQVSTTTVNITQTTAKAPDPRILIISVSPDLSTSYIPLMNSIFSAQKLKVTIDICKLYGPDTVFLQQAAHLTGGSYLYLEQKDALLQYLIMTFLPPPRLRQFIATPKQDKVDFRAACFCHKDIVDVGFVCSVCLSSASYSDYNLSETTQNLDLTMIPYSFLSTRACVLHVQNEIPHENATTTEQFPSLNPTKQRDYHPEKWCAITLWEAFSFAREAPCCLTRWVHFHRGEIEGRRDEVSSKVEPNLIHRRGGHVGMGFPFNTDGAHP